MRTIIFYILLLFYSSVLSQSRVTVKECRSINWEGIEDLNDKYYSIKIDSIKMLMDELIEYDEIEEMETIRLIEQLLTFESDTRKVCHPIMNYNKASSLISTRNKEKIDADGYSVAIEALFLINQLCLEKPFSYSPYPIISSKNENQNVVKEAYESYRLWFEEVKKIGITETRKTRLYPLDKNDSVYWEYGNW